MFWKIASALSLSLICCTGEVQAKNRMSASFAWTSAQLSEIQFSPAKFRQGRVALEFSDPRKGDEIEKIVLDPTFKPKHQMPDGTSVSDFFLDTIIKSPKSGAKIRETALCDWDQAKSVATCSIEDDGGRFQIAVASRSEKLSLVFVVLSLDGYNGFRIADSVQIKLKKPDSVVKSPIGF
jgi:hypothetical protein